MGQKSEAFQTPKLPVGMILGGRYKLGAMIGQGGFSFVYRGQQVNVDQDIAIKLLKVPFNARQGFLERFSREAQLAAKIQHPDIVTIFDYGVVDDNPYIVMELLRGHTLTEELQTNGPMAVERALRLMVRCLDALHAAHTLGIVHRDLKPDNLFLTGAGTRVEALQLLDFGVAHMLDHHIRLTSPGELFGTPRYLPPEYVRDKKVATSFDVYQMGLILVELLTAEPVITGENNLQCMINQCQGPRNVPKTLQESALGPVIAKAIARDPEERYQTAGEFRDVLEAVSDEQRKVIQSKSLQLGKQTLTFSSEQESDSETPQVTETPQRREPDVSQIFELPTAVKNTLHLIAADFDIAPSEDTRAVTPALHAKPQILTPDDDSAHKTTGNTANQAAHDLHKARTAPLPTRTPTAPPTQPTASVSAPSLFRRYVWTILGAALFVLLAGSGIFLAVWGTKTTATPDKPRAVDSRKAPDQTAPVLAKTNKAQPKDKPIPNPEVPKSAPEVQRADTHENDSKAVTVTVVVDPSEASLQEGNKTLGKGTVLVSFDDSKPRQLRATLAGYQSHTFTVLPGDAPFMRLKLVRNPKKKSAQPTPKAPSVSEPSTPLPEPTTPEPEAPAKPKPRQIDFLE